MPVAELARSLDDIPAAAQRLRVPITAHAIVVFGP
jgi:hypothetical protein